MRFSDYANAKGLKVLREDLTFIRKRLPNVPHKLHRAILRNYVEQWLSGMAKCTDALRTQNAGRSAANEYLLEVTKDKNAKRHS